MRERQWLTSHGFTSWESLHTKLMNGDIALDKSTPAYSKQNHLYALYSKLQPNELDLSISPVDDNALITLDASLPKGVKIVRKKKS